MDHDTNILSHADWLLEMGPGAGASGGTILTQGSVESLIADPASRIGPYLAGKAAVRSRPEIAREDACKVEHDLSEESSALSAPSEQIPLS